MEPHKVANKETALFPCSVLCMKVLNAGLQDGCARPPGRMKRKVKGQNKMILSLLTGHEVACSEASYPLQQGGRNQIYFTLTIELPVFSGCRLLWQRASSRVRVVYTLNMLFFSMYAKIISLYYLLTKRIL